MINFTAQHTLKTSQSMTLMPLEERSDSIIYCKLDVSGNSMLSTVFVESCSGSVKVDYYDFTTGFDVGEKNDLKSHLLLDSAPGFDRILVTNAHDKIVMKMTIVGTVKYSVYGTIVSNSVSDLDAALVKENELINFLLAKAIPMAAVYGDIWKFLRTNENGYLYVEPVAEEEEGFFHEFIGLTVPGEELHLFDIDVPQGVFRKLSKIILTSNESGLFRFYLNGAIIATGRIKPGKSNVTFEWNPKRKIYPSDNYKLTYETYENRPAKAIEGYIMGIETIQ